MVTCALRDQTCGCAPAPQCGVAAVALSQADVVCEVGGQHQGVFNTLSLPQLKYCKIQKNLIGGLATVAS